MPKKRNPKRKKDESSEDEMSSKKEEEPETEVNYALLEQIQKATQVTTLT